MAGLLTVTAEETEEAKAQGMVEEAMTDTRTKRGVRKLERTVEPAPPGRYIISIPNFHPTTLNKLLTSHHMAAHRMKAADTQMIGVYAYIAKVPKAAGKRRLEIVITLAPGQRGADNDAYFKVCLDSLVSLSLLKDDNRQQLELEPVRYERGAAKATTLILTELPL